MPITHLTRKVCFDNLSVNSSVAPFTAIFRKTCRLAWRVIFETPIVPGCLL